MAIIDFLKKYFFSKKTDPEKEEGLPERRQEGASLNKTSRMKNMVRRYVYTNSALKLLVRNRLPVYELHESVTKKLETGKTEYVAQWLVDELCKLHNKSNNAQTKRGNSLRQRKYSRLVNFFEDGAEAEEVYRCFQALKTRYVQERKSKGALMMLHFCAVFGRLSDVDFEWAFKTAISQGIISGFWLGEASRLYAMGASLPYSEQVLKQAADQGNEMSQFILDCYQTRG